MMDATSPQAQEVLLTLSQVDHCYRLPSGATLPVCLDINFTLLAGELVAILGPSGCGKSTLIRIAAGLLRPMRGIVQYRGQPIVGPQPKVALVFQQVALFPWLTVAQNIEQALVPRGVPPEVRRKQVAEIITLIGLDGFEEAYPRELSGGMKQRVGIARALVVQPELLCMDEPFSQVDALTAEMLRNEVVNLWRDRERYPQSIFLVSHDIQEVVFMASRILIMTANPGRLKTIIENPLPYPRDPRSGAYQALVDRLHGIITGLYLPEQEPTIRPTVAVTEVTATGVTEPVTASPPTIAPLPTVEVREIAGLLEAVENRGGDVEFFRLTVELGKAFTRIVLAVKAAEVLAFLQTPQDHLVLTDLGRQFVNAPRKLRRQLFRRQLLQVALIKRLREMVEHSPERRLDKEVVLEELAIQCPQEDPKRLFRALVNWGRFAELWFYQPSTATLSAESGNHQSAQPPLASDAHPPLHET